MTAEKHHALLWTAVVAVVLALHGAALWGLQMGMMRAPEAASLPPMISVIQMVVRRADPAQQLAAVSLPAARPVIQPRAQPVQAKAERKPVSKPAAVALPRSQPVSVQPSPLSERPAPAAQTKPEAEPESAPAVSEQSAPALASADQADGAPTGPSSAANGAEPAAQAQEAVVPVMASAAYLHNPPPEYPPVSRMRHETGTVMVRVLIGVDGRAQKGRIAKSSGYPRLDDAALIAARDRWSYRLNTSGGVSRAMWFDVPIRFALNY